MSTSTWSWPVGEQFRQHVPSPDVPEPDGGQEEAGHGPGHRQGGDPLQPGHLRGHVRGDYEPRDNIDFTKVQVHHMDDETSSPSVEGSSDIYDNLSVQQVNISRWKILSQ